MKKKQRNIRLIQFFYRKDINIFVFIVLSIYVITLLVENNSSEKNIYDLFIQLTGFLSLSYLIVPAYLIVLTTYFSQGIVQNYLAFRFKNKQQWYHANLVSIAQLTIGFLLTIAIITLMQSLFVLGFKNEWSNFALSYYSYHSIFLKSFSPFFYSLASFFLVGLFLFLLGLLFYLIFIWTRNPMISLLFIISLIVINAAITLGKFDTISLFFFTDHVSIMQYIYKFELDQHNFPYSIFIYWLILISIFYSLGRFLINRVDIDIEKGEKSVS